MSSSQSVSPQKTRTSPPVVLSRRWHWASRQAISFLMQQAVENPDVISLAAGLVDPVTLPVEETQSAVADLLRDPAVARHALQYGTTAGSLRLREQLLKYLARLEKCSVKDLGLESEQIVLTTGSQQLLSLVGEILLDPEDICLVAAPTYFVFLGTLNGLGAQAVAVKTDQDGMCMDALEQKLAELESQGKLDRVKLIYLVSYYENPSGLSLSAERRERVVDIAGRWSKNQKIFILEDTAYRELHYDGPVLPSVWSFDESRESVIQALTFSKSYSPGLRVGFGAVPKSLVTPICDRKGNEDFGSANFNQNLLAIVHEQGLFETHVEMLRNSYREKRDAMLAAADDYFSGLDGVDWVHPHGGLYVWMTLPEEIETSFESELFQRAAQVDEVMYVPGELCYPSATDSMTGVNASPPTNHMRLSFGVQTPEGIDEGMRRLASAVRFTLDRS